MTIASLKFDLNDPDDAENFEIHCKAIEQHCARDEFSHFLHKGYKHKVLSPEQEALLVEIQEKFAECFFGD
jgi:hypothetical protein